MREEAEAAGSRAACLPDGVRFRMARRKAYGERSGSGREVRFRTRG